MVHYLLDWDFATAAGEFRLGMERNPTLLAQGLYSWFLWATGQFDEAVAVMNRIIDSEPTTAQWPSDVGWDYYAAGDSAQARRYALRAIALDSAFYEPHHLLTWIEVDAGNFREAHRALSRAAAAAGGDFWLLRTLEGYIMARSGDTAGAHAVLRELKGDPRLAQQAMLWHALGQQDSMYAVFERAIDARDPDAIWILNSTPALRLLRPEPRYQRLLERMGLPEPLR